MSKNQLQMGSKQPGKNAYSVDQVGRQAGRQTTMQTNILTGILVCRHAATKSVCVNTALVDVLSKVKMTIVYRRQHHQTPPDCHLESCHEFIDPRLLIPDP